MKRILIPLLFILSLSVVSFIKPYGTLSNDEALDLGVDKYLKFLWMIDGAFNNERLHEEFTVNGKKISKEDKIFTCKYKNTKSKECTANNFETEFKKLFSKNISYEKVYTDQAIYSWIYYKNGNYVFKNLDTCNVDRMGINHNIKVIEIKNNKIVYEVLFENRQSHLMNKKYFKLINEDNEWKISNAFYYDLCGMRYTIN